MKNLEIQTIQFLRQELVKKDMKILELENCVKKMRTSEAQRHKNYICANLGHISTERQGECRDGYECLICSKINYDPSDHKWQRKNCVEKICTKC